MPQAAYVKKGKSVFKEIEVTQEQIDYANSIDPLVELIESKLMDVKRGFKRDLAALGVTNEDQLNHNNPNIKTTPEEKAAMAKFEALRLKLYDIKRLIRSRTDIEKLNTIEWETFTRNRWLAFFGISY